MTKKLLIIGAVWPEPTSSAAGYRMMSIIQSFIEVDFAITFCASSSATDHSADLQSLDIDCVHYLPNDQRFDAFITQLNPDIVIFDRFYIEEQFGWRVAENSPHSIRVLDSEDLHFLRKARQQARTDNLTLATLNLFNEIAFREIASIYRCDLTLVISEYELQLLQQEFRIPDALLHYLPFMIDKIAMDSKPNTYEQRRDFVWIGNFLHEPNWDAVQVLSRFIWPKIRQKIPYANMHVYGAYMPEKAKQLHCTRSGFFMHGRAEKADEVIANARLCLAPIRFGAGLKGKLVESALLGTPCITTTIGAEGIAGEFAWHGRIADTFDKFTSSAVELFENKSLWNEAQANGKHIVQSRFDSGLHRHAMLTKLAHIEANISEHRHNNFYGNMLSMQQYRSTKFMSKWISAKNTLTEHGLPLP